MRERAAGHLLLMLVGRGLADLHALLEDQHAAIANRLERRDVAAIETSLARWRARRRRRVAFRCARQDAAARRIQPAPRDC